MILAQMESTPLAPATPTLRRSHRIRTLFIITTLQTGGAQMMLYKLLAGMDRSRFDPTVICLGGTGRPGAQISALGVAVHVAEMSPTRPSPRSLWRLCRWVRDLRPGLIQGWMYHGNAAASFAQCLAFRRIPVLWSIRQTVYSLRDEKARTAAVIRLSARISRRTFRIVYASRVSADQHEALGFAADRTTIIPNGFDCDQFKPAPHARHVLRKDLNVGEDAILIGLINRFHPMKDHATFLKAADMISRTNRTTHFVLAGQGINSQNAVLMEMAERPHLRGRIHFLGKRYDIPELTAGLDIATNSSAFGESFPNVIGEAMACGVPCVVTDIGHSAAIVGETGLVVPPRNPAALAAAWTRLVDAGAPERAKLGATARQRVKRNFSLDLVVRQYEALYEEALRHSRSTSAPPGVVT
jgi:glycosyltransferase involved in cell wall biosynthesis